MPLSPTGEAKSQEIAEKVPHVAPWMINVVLASLPYLADRDAIKRALEESKGNIDTAVSALMDAEERASVSSQPGSSSTERDPDSDDEEFYGPNKKQDRRMSRATKALRKQKAEGTNPEGVSTDDHESKASVPQSPSVELPVRPAKQTIPRLVFKQPKPEQVEKQEIPASDDDAESHLDVDEAEDDAGSEYSSKSRSLSTVPELYPPKNNLKIVFKQQGQKPPPNQKKRVTARERIEQKKSAQKAARKESKRTGAASSRQLEVTSVNISKTAPPHDLGMGIKTLYI
jgi:OTU domain-containing protein 3